MYDTYPCASFFIGMGYVLEERGLLTVFTLKFLLHGPKGVGI